MKNKINITHACTKLDIYIQSENLLKNHCSKIFLSVTILNESFVGYFCALLNQVILQVILHLIMYYK